MINLYSGYMNCMIILSIIWEAALSRFDIEVLLWRQDNKCIHVLYVWNHQKTIYTKRKSFVHKRFDILNVPADIEFYLHHTLKLRIVSGRGGTSPEPSEKYGLKVQGPFSSIEPEWICLKELEALLSVKEYIFYLKKIPQQKFKHLL